jgi:pyrrolidone-carboxylate peptidase
MIHVGVSKGDQQISVEKRAFNTDYQHEDISSKCPDGKCCVAHAQDTLETGLNVDKLVEFSNKNFEFFKSIGINTKFY